MEVKAKITVNDLMVKVMKGNNLTGKKLAEKWGHCEGHVTSVTKHAKNHWIETVTGFFEAADQPFTILNKQMKPFKVPGTITTMNQLRKKLGTFYFQFENGLVFEIIPYETWNAAGDQK